MRADTILDRSSEAYFEVDSGGLVTDWNSQAERIFGWSRADVLGQALPQFMIPSRNRNRFQDTLLRLFDSKDEECVEITALSREGNELHVQLTIFPIPRRLRMFARFQVAPTSEEAEKLHRNLMDQVAEPYVEVDLSGAFVFVNKSFCQAYGVPAQDAHTGVNYKNLIDARSEAVIRDAYQEVYRTQRPRQVEYLIKALGGGETYVESSVALRRDIQGRPVGFMAFTRDLSARKRYEDEITIARDAAEAASQAKGEFLANMSHEIRTPLNGVIGMLNLARNTDLTAEQSELIGIAATSANSLLGLINDILDFSKIEAGKLQFDCIEFNLVDTLAKVTRGMAIDAHAKGLELAYSIAPEVPRVLLGDPLRLTQVLTNLLGNAIKFTSKGQVVLRVALDQPGATQIRFSIADTGIGIPAEKQDLIFDAFSQADASTTRTFGGTGLGLAICSRIVRLMGGNIWVESAAAKGSTFHFTAAFDLPDRPPTSESAPDRTEGIPVLVVDDNLTTREILKDLLASWKMRPVIAASAAAALEIATRAADAGDPFRIVLADCHMPDMNGFQLVDRLRQNLIFAVPTIMMLTSNDYQDGAKRCREIGVSAHLMKPVAQAELLSALKSVLRGEQPAVSRTEAEGAAVDYSRSKSRSLKILLAEDNLINQMLAMRLLDKLGHRVVVANNGREALDALEAQRFDLILMDVQMPEMDGFTATGAIRAKEEATETRTPIVALTAHAMAGDRERCLQAGMDDYIVKPIDPVLLRETIERVTGAAAPDATSEQLELLALAANMTAHPSTEP